MKKKFSTNWIRSKQPRKQIKYRANAPLHIRHKLVSTSLSKELRKKHGRRSVMLRKGDSVKILRGKFKGKSGKIDIVNLKRLRVSIEGIQTQKKDGTKISIYFEPSNLQVQELTLEDRKRIKKLSKEEEIDVKKGEENAPKKK